MISVSGIGNSPIWLVSVFLFFAIGIPFFFLFYLGLKILVKNLKSIGHISKFTLLGLWVISIIGIIIIGVQEARHHAIEESYIEKTTLPIKATDTLIIKMTHHEKHKTNTRRHTKDFKVIYNKNGNQIIYTRDIEILVKSTTDSVASLSVIKSANGSDFETAINRAKDIHYHFDFNNNTLLLNSFLTTPINNKYSDQEVNLILYLPEGTTFFLNKNTKSYIPQKKHDELIISNKSTNHFFRVLDNNSKCLDCNNIPVSKAIQATEVKINGDGIKVQSEKMNINIDSDGIEIN